MTWEVRQGDALEKLREMPGASVDAVVTDPPAGIAFMGKEWDSFPVRGSGERMPPGKRLTESGSETDSVGFANGIEIRTGKREREAFIAFLSAVMAEALRVLKPGAYGLVWAIPRTSHWTATALEDAGFEIRDRIAHLFGQGFPKAKSCLKPACEDWWLVRKPGKGVAPLGIDECRIATEDDTARHTNHTMRGGNYENHQPSERIACGGDPAGRWPANVVLDEEAARLVDEASGERASGGVTHQPKRSGYSGFREGRDNGTNIQREPDTGGASRFFYVSKASPADRGEGNTHPTVKNTDLMAWLVKLVSREGETVLDPFNGSGTTGIACWRCNRHYIGIEREPEYVRLSYARWEAEKARTPLFD